jgi:hypothetical protein
MESASRLGRDPRGRHVSHHAGCRDLKVSLKGMILHGFDVHFTSVAPYNGAYVI